MWLWIRHCKDNKCLIDICYCRTDQFVFPWKNLNNISRLLFLTQAVDLYIISDEWFSLLFSETSFCLTLINTESYYMNVVESGNSFYNLSLHEFSLIHLFVWLPGTNTQYCTAFVPSN